MSACIVDNDPLPYSARDAMKVVVLYGGIVPKRLLAAA